MFFTPPPIIEAKPFTRVPKELELTGRPSAWAYRQARGPVGAFLEGPSFDREGNLWLVDIAHGRIFRVSPDGDWDVVAQYDGQPNGLKIHRDGRVFIADFVRGIMELDPVSGKVEPYLDRDRFPDFKGFNDLFFASNGDLYFTDQGLTGLHDPTGRVWRHRAADGRLECLIDTVPSPNGLVMARDESMLFIAVTRANAVWRMPFDPEGRPFKVGLFVQLQGGSGGPDGMAMDAEGNLSVVQHGAGKTWLLSPAGEPVACIVAPTGPGVTNLAYGGPENRTLYITESGTGHVLAAEMDAPGEPMYSHRDAR